MKLKSFVLFGLLLLAQETFATVNNFYAGFNWSVRELKLKRGGGKEFLPRNSYGPQVLVGYKYNDDLGFEISGSQLKKKSKFDNSVKSYHIALDALGFYPLSECASIYGGIGVGLSKLSFNIKNVANIKKSRIAPRLSAGAQLSLTDAISLRLSEAMESSGSVKNMKNIKYSSMFMSSVGLIYSF